MDDLEKRVAALEVQVQELQSQIIALSNVNKDELLNLFAQHSHQAYLNLAKDLNSTP